MTKKDDRSDYLLRPLVHAVNWVDESLQNTIETYGWNRLPKTQSLIMANISDGIVRPSQLAKILGISRQAIHQTLAEMAEKDLVVIETDPTDGRAKIVKFSPSAIAIRDDGLKASIEIERELAKRIGRKALNNLKAALSLDWGLPVNNPDASE